VGIKDGFTKTCKTKRLIYFEETSDVHAALAREKQLKNWHRQWKINVIEENNPDWKDLWHEIGGFDINDAAQQ
jgi:putative endonuclease